MEEEGNEQRVSRENTPDTSDNEAENSEETSSEEESGFDTEPEGEALENGIDPHGMYRISPEMRALLEERHELRRQAMREDLLLEQTIMQRDIILKKVKCMEAKRDALRAQRIQDEMELEELGLTDLEIDKVVSTVIEKEVEEKEEVK